MDSDINTGKQFGWVPITAQDKWHLEALDEIRIEGEGPEDGTFELIGPKINGNPEKCIEHVLIEHTWETEIFHRVPRTFDELRQWLAGRDIEGLVFHHGDGRMAKIRLKDFGLRRNS